MASLVIDTNVLSELTKVPANANVVTWFSEQNPADLHLTAITLMELEKGVELKRRTDEKRANQIRTQCDTLIQQYGDRILPFDTRAAGIAGKFLAQFPNVQVEDAQIASIAKANGMTVVTRNVRDFISFGVPYHNPF